MARDAPHNMDGPLPEGTRGIVDYTHAEAMMAERSQTLKFNRLRQPAGRLCLSCIFQTASQRGKVRRSPGGLEGPHAMLCVDPGSNVTNELLARPRASRWLGRYTATWILGERQPRTTHFCPWVVPLMPHKEIFNPRAETR